jgi:hypothetical protein
MLIEKPLKRCLHSVRVCMFTAALGAAGDSAFVLGDMRSSLKKQSPPVWQAEVSMTRCPQSQLKDSLSQALHLHIAQMGFSTPLVSNSPFSSCPLHQMPHSVDPSPPSKPQARVPVPSCLPSVPFLLRVNCPLVFAPCCDRGEQQRTHQLLPSCPLMQ